MRTLGIEEAEGDVGLLEVRTKNRNLEAARNLGAVRGPVRRMSSR